MKTLTQHSPPHPGEILLELYFAPLNLTVSEVAAKLMIPRQKLSSIVHGRMGISAGTALRLARAFKTTPWYWMNIQINYDLWVACEIEKPLLARIHSPMPVASEKRQHQKS